jgi:hypothetical protein
MGKWEFSLGFEAKIMSLIRLSIKKLFKPSHCGIIMITTAIFGESTLYPRSINAKFFYKESRK